MPREVKDSRRVIKKLFELESLNTLYDIRTPKGYDVSEGLAEGYTNNLLFNEHTFSMAMPHGRNGTWAYGDDFKIQRAKRAYQDIGKSWKVKVDRVFSADKIITPSLNQQLRELASEVDISGKRIFVLDFYEVDPSMNTECFEALIENADYGLAPRQNERRILL